MNLGYTLRLYPTLWLYLKLSKNNSEFSSIVTKIYIQQESLSFQQITIEFC